MRSDASRNRERILRAAREAVRDCGTEVPFNDEVPRRADVGNATVYRHFTTRLELIHQVTLSSMRLITGDAERALAKESDVFEALQHWAMDARIGALGPLIGDNSGGTTAQEVDRARTRLAHALEAMMVQARKAGSLRADVAVDDLVMVLAQLTGPLPGTVYVNFRQSAHRHLQLFLDGLRSRRVKPSGRPRRTRTRTHGREESLCATRHLPLGSDADDRRPVVVLVRPQNPGQPPGAQHEGGEHAQFHDLRGGEVAVKFTQYGVVDCQVINREELCET